MEKKKSTGTYALCLYAVLTSLTFALTFVNVRLPVQANGGLIHMGNIPVTVAAIVFGKKYGAASGAVGMALFDLVGGWVIWAPFTFVIRLVAGYVIGLLAEKGQGKSFGWNLSGVLAGGVVMTLGYYIAEWIIYGNPAAPLASIPGDMMQVASAVILGIPLAAAVRKTLHKTLANA